MDTFVIGQVAFWWAQYKIKPAKVVDYLINVVVDVLVPPSGSSSGGNSVVGGAHNW